MRLQQTEMYQTQMVKSLCSVFNLQEQRDFAAAAWNVCYDFVCFDEFCNAKYVYVQQYQRNIECISISKRQLSVCIQWINS